MVCQICGKEVANLGMSKHLKTHDLDVRAYYDLYLKKSDEGICKVCSKPTRFVSVTTGYKTYCSTKCGMSDPIVRQKVSEKTKQATDKIKERNLEKYGVEWTTQLDSTKEKFKKTMISRYGVDSAMKSDQIREKHKQSMKNNLGVEYAVQSSDIQSKIKQTNIERYGVVCPLQQDLVKEKAIKNAWSKKSRDKREQTCTDRYGVSHNLKREEVQAKAHTPEINAKRLKSTRQTILEKYNVTCGYLLPEVREKALKNAHSPEAELKRIETMKNHISNAEKLFIELANLHGLEIEMQHYDDKYPYLCDFYVKSLDLYIEVNAFWTHGGHWFDKNSQIDIDILNKWKSKKSKFYDNAIYTWTDLDVRKRSIAKENNLNYITLWTLSDINAWFLLDCPIGKDYNELYSWYKPRVLHNELAFSDITKINKNVKYCQFNVFYEKELDFWNKNSKYNNSQLNEQLMLYENRLKYINKSYSQLSDLEIIRGLNISGKVRSYTVFNKVGMTTFIEKYKPTAIYDPCAGWGERLLICANHNIDYYGYDINKKLKVGYNKIINHFGLTKQKFSTEVQGNIYKYDCLFTCPPYWNTEIYTKDGAENLNYKDFLNWWKQIISKSNCSLIAYQINQKYKDDMNQVIIDLGYELIDEIQLPKQVSHFNKKHKKTEFESIFVLRRAI